MRAALLDGTVEEVCVEIKQNDLGDVANDRLVTMSPNVEPFVANGRLDVFPAWNLGVDPARVRFSWDARGPTVSLDENYRGTNLFFSLAIKV